MTTPCRTPGERPSEPEERAAVVAWLTKSERGMKRSRRRHSPDDEKYRALTGDLHLLRRLRAGIERGDHRAAKEMGE